LYLKSSGLFPNSIFLRSDDTINLSNQKITQVLVLGKKKPTSSERSGLWESL
jgi:hypothetical protein